MPARILPPLFGALITLAAGCDADQKAIEAPGYSTAKAITLTNMGPDSADSGLYGQVSALPFYPASYAPSYLNTNGSIDLDGGNVSLTTTSLYSTTTPYIQVSADVNRDGASEILSFDSTAYTISGSTLYRGTASGTAIGTVTATGVGTALAIELNSSAAVSDIQALLPVLTYQNTAGSPTTGDRVLTVAVHNGANLATDTLTVSVTLSLIHI